MEIDTIGTLESSEATHAELMEQSLAHDPAYILRQQGAMQREQSGQASGLGALGQLGGLGGGVSGAINAQLGQAASQNWHPGGMSNPNFHRSLQEGIQEVFTSGNRESFGFSDPRGVNLQKAFMDGYKSTKDNLKLPHKDPYHTTLIDRLLYYKSKIMLSIGERILDYCGD